MPMALLGSSKNKYLLTTANESVLDGAKISALGNRGADVEAEFRMKTIIDFLGLGGATNEHSFQLSTEQMDCLPQVKMWGMAS